MASILRKRIFTALIQIFAVATIVFFVMHSMPGDPAKMMLESDGGTATEEQVTALKTELGLDKPITMQYVSWMQGLLTLNVGKSYYYKQPVSDFIGKRLPATMELAVTALVLAVLLGIAGGLISAVRHGKPADTLMTSVSVLGFSIPNFVMGTLLIVLFGLVLGVLPTSGYMKIERNAVMHFRYLILPALTLAFGMAATIARVTRSALMDEVNKEYIQTLYSKGMKPGRVVLVHALKNALTSIVTVIGLQFGAMLGGTCVVEKIFNWPGLSSLIVESVQHRDYPMIQTAIVVIAVIYILINTAVELSFGLIDPRMRRGGQK